MADSPISQLESGHDAGKWVNFAGRVFALMLISVVTIAGLTAVISTRQAQGLLEDSLTAQGRALADALARAAFVPLTLEDRASLATLVNTYRDIDNVASVEIRDAHGQSVQKTARADARTPAVSIQSPIIPIDDSGEARSASAPIGLIEVRLWSEKIKAKSRKIAWINVLVSGTLALVISAAGFFVLRKTVARMRDLVGEARLVAQVKRANAELESFSYSVSHDLRAPLRAVDGFSRVILEEYSDRFDDEGKRLFQVIRNNTQKMGQLIDDLLALSHLGRKEIVRAPIDMAALARAVFEEVKGERPAEIARCAVKELPKAHGDSSLIRQVLANLLSNAVKFTGKNQDGAIEVGVNENDHECEYYVKDNGAGFDMIYAHKLFGVFQRLHGQDEFQGTGVGLAIVKRIVERHGGRVWAQSRKNVGTTFYFTLPKGA